MTLVAVETRAEFAQPRRLGGDQPRRSRPGRRTALRWTAVLVAAAAAGAGLSQVPDALAGGDDVAPRCLGPARVIDVAVTPEVRTAVMAVATR